MGGLPCGPGDMDRPWPGDIARGGPFRMAGLIERPWGGPMAGDIGRCWFGGGPGRGFDGLAARQVLGTTPCCERSSRVQRHC